MKMICIVYFVHNRKQSTLCDVCHTHQGTSDSEGFASLTTPPDDIPWDKIAKQQQQGKFDKKWSKVICDACLNMVLIESNNPSARMIATLLPLAMYEITVAFVLDIPTDNMVFAMKPGHHTAQALMKEISSGDTINIHMK